MAAKKKAKDTGKKPEGAAKAEANATAVKQESGEAQTVVRAKTEEKASTMTVPKKEGGSAKANNKEGAAAKPKAKKQEKGEGESGNAIAHALQFLKEVNIEARKITWPERSLILRETWGVIVLVAVLTFLVLGFDWAVGHFVFQPLEHWSRVLGGGTGR